MMRGTRALRHQHSKSTLKWVPVDGVLGVEPAENARPTVGVA
jgi:hypothetical protein